LGRIVVPLDRVGLQLGAAHLGCGRARLPRFRGLEREATCIDRLLGLIRPDAEQGGDRQAQSPTCTAVQSNQSSHRSMTPRSVSIAGPGLRQAQGRATLRFPFPAEDFPAQAPRARRTDPTRWAGPLGATPVKRYSLVGLLLASICALPQPA